MFVASVHGRMKSIEVCKAFIVHIGPSMELHTVCKSVQGLSVCLSLHGEWAWGAWQNPVTDLSQVCDLGILLVIGPTKQKQQSAISGGQF